MIKGWTETDGEYRQRLTDEAWGRVERREREAGLAIRPLRPAPVQRLVLAEVVGNDHFYKNVPLSPKP